MRGDMAYVSKRDASYVEGNRRNRQARDKVVEQEVGCTIQGHCIVNKNPRIFVPSFNLLDRKLVSIEAMHHSCSSYSKDPRSYKFHARTISSFSNPESTLSFYLLLRFLERGKIVTFTIDWHSFGNHNIGPLYQIKLSSDFDETLVIVFAAKSVLRC